MSASVHIIIVSYNGAAWIDACLDSIKQSSVKPFTWILDNQSSDDTLERIQRHEIEKEVLVMDANLGFGRANNIGISKALKAGAEYVFLLNQDAYLQKETIQHLMDTADKESHGILSPIHLNGKGDRLDYNFGKYYVGFDVNPLLLSDALKGKLKASYVLPFVNAAAWFIPRNTFETVGGFDPLFQHYGEDDNYCQRLRFHGLSLALVTDAFILHDREEPNMIKPLPFSERGLARFRRKLKTRYANPSYSDFPVKYDEETKRYLTWSFRNKLKLKSEDSLGYSLMAKIMEEERASIASSREISVLKGTHYLDL
jgi:GT2 family glycosyltransferase